MEHRVQKLETTISELNTEVRLMNQTLSSISETLSDFKEILKAVNKIEIEIAEKKKDIESNSQKIDYLIKTTDEYDTRLDNLEKNDVGTDLKLGGAEKFTWIVIGGIVSFAIALFGGK